MTKLTDLPINSKSEELHTEFYAKIFTQRNRVDARVSQNVSATEKNKPFATNGENRRYNINNIFSASHQHSILSVTNVHNLLVSTGQYLV